MAITSKFLKDIMSEARPIIERQMDDAKLISGFRETVASNGGDWGALKALIKAHIEDENDETGEGKRVNKILEKADCSTAYADMLGLANMNENNFSASPSYAGETALVSASDGGPEGGKRLQVLRGPNHAAEPDVLSATREWPSMERGMDQCVTGGESAATDFEAPKSRPEASVNPAAHIDTPATEKSGLAGPAYAQDAVQANTKPAPFEPPAFLKKDHVLRPHCQRPELCGGYGRKHCGTCEAAISKHEVAA